MAYHKDIFSQFLKLFFRSFLESDISNQIYMPQLIVCYFHEILTI